MSGVKKITESLLRSIVLRYNKYLLYPINIVLHKNIKGFKVIETLVDTNFNKHQPRAVDPPLDNFRHVLVLAPHQDDEAIGCGGTLQKFHPDCLIEILFITDGSNKEKDINPMEYSEIRNKEAREAARFCNARPHFLELDNMNLKANKKSVNKLSRFLLERQPDLIFIPWILDRPKKHRISSFLINEALLVSNYGIDTPMWMYQVHNHLISNIVVDITEEFSKKIDMLRCYSSQLKIVRYDRLVTGLNLWNSQFVNTVDCTYAEIFFRLSLKDLLQMHKSYLRTNEEHYIDYT